MPKRSDNKEDQEALQPMSDVVNNQSSTQGNEFIPSFSVDHSIKGTAKCKKSKKVIVKGVLRIGKTTIFKKRKTLCNSITSIVLIVRFTHRGNYLI